MLKALATCSFLKTSEDGDGVTFLGNVFGCLNLLLVKKLFLISILNFHCFSLCLLFHPPDMHFCEKPCSISFIASSCVWKGCFWVLPRPPLHAEEFRFPQLFLISVQSYNFGDPSLNLLHFIDVMRSLRLDALLQVIHYYTNKC